MGRSNPSRETKFSGPNGDREIFTFFPVQLRASKIGNLTRLIYTLLYVMPIHTYYITNCPIRTGDSHFDSSSIVIVVVEVVESQEQSTKPSFVPNMSSSVEQTHTHIYIARERERVLRVLLFHHRGMKRVFLLCCAGV